VHSLNTFGARTSHGQPQTHKTYYNLDLGGGETTTFPLIVYYVPLHEAHIQMAFCLRAFCPEIPKVGSPMTLGPHNFMCRPSIEIRSKAKL
jgi:hypothetical protein